MPYLDKMAIKIEDIMFWILITAIIAVAIWLLIGSPPLENGLLMIVIFVAGSEILLWKALFKIDNKTSTGFIKIRNELANLGKNFNNKLDSLDNKLNSIDSLIRKRK